MLVKLINRLKHGKYFQQLREAKNLTLRDVAKQVDVASGYLSQIETEKIKQPSPNLLFKLAEVYGVSYENLMEKVGYPVPKSKAISHKLGNLTKEEETEMLEYLSFIRKRKRI